MDSADLFSAVDRVAEILLARARFAGPPVDALELAERLNIAVAIDASQTVRARQKRIGCRPSVFLRPEPRLERYQWAIAHEIAEQTAYRVFQLAGVAADEVSPTLREQAAALPLEQLQRFVRERVRVELVTQVQDVLLHQEASKGITDQILGVVDRYVDQEIRDRVTREFGGRQTRFEVHLASMGMTLEDAREKVRRRIVIVKYLQDHVIVRIADPTRQELLDYYNTNIESYTQQSSRELCMIDIPKGDDAQASRTAIEEARSRLDAGEDFRDVARGLSLGIHAAEGGSWGHIKSPLHGRYAEPSAIFFKLDEGRSSGVVETDDAFFIVKAGDVIESETRPFVDVQPELVERYRNAQFEILRSEKVRELLEKAAIEPREDLFLRTVVDSAVAQLASGAAR
ncbi:MAG: peptidyl-prolyl cis-trans isomerase [Planctomycetes bacterium]|nr:peptidyl-prolyl cis-trans isomerase [Planctomycetota bacterium]